MRFRAMTCLTVAAIVFFSTGCGPIISSYLIVSAQADLDGAKAAEAEKYAIYEYTAAEQYLHKAREEQGYADFGPAIDFAYKADSLAGKALQRANDEKKKQAEQPSDAEWQAPNESGKQPSVIIKKKKPERPEDDGEQSDKPKMRIVPVPNDEGPAPK